MQVPGAVEGSVEDRNRLQRRLNAALICALEPVNRFTKVVIMDSCGRTNKSLAREVASLGYRGYHFKGGFRAWKDTGLAITYDGDYSESAGLPFPLMPTATANI
jgi:rhodanese-related sulfurtransferase